MKFNQQLIEKARKGEIAILNDGSVEELRDVVKEVWPYVTDAVPSGLKQCYQKHSFASGWEGVDNSNLPANSVRLFFSRIDDTTLQP